LDRIRVWWHAPKLHQEEEQGRERKVSWLELFYDLVFVVIIARLSHYLGHHLDWSGAVGFFFLFVPVYWVWIGGTIYNDRFETYDVSYRTFVFLQLLAVSSMAVFIEGGLGKTAAAFAWSYVAARLIIVVLWWRGGRHNPVARPLTHRFVLGFSTSAGLWALSTLVENPLSLALKGIGLAIDVLTPLTSIAIQQRLPRLSTGKMTERFGLFVIIVLGESLLGVINGFADAETTSFVAIARFGLGMALVFSLWWIYFDFIARRHPTPILARRMTWTYSHLFLLAGITALSALLVHIVGLKGEALADTPRWILLGAYAVTMTAMGVIVQMLAPEKHRVIDEGLSTVLLLAAAGAALLLGLLKAPASILLLVLVVFNLGFMFFGAISWFASPASKELYTDEI
jgi:low temperature requirement protein LtrA